MALDFTKVVTQVKKMGRTMANQNTSLHERVELALEQFENLPSNAEVLEQVKLARTRDAGYRGVAPLEKTDSEPLNTVYACPDLPNQATLLAVDGSQIYPDQHAAAFYFLTNVGGFTYYHGTDRLPREHTEPRLFYELEDTHDRAGNPIKNAYVNAQRTVRELEFLASLAWDSRQEESPLLAFYDGPLLFWLGKDVEDSENLERLYYRALTKLSDTHRTLQTDKQGSASLIGYVDRPTSRFVIAMLRLMELDEVEVRRRILETMGDYEGLTDTWLFREILQPGERSALMVQQSPQNKLYRQEVGDDFEIAFFYVNVARFGTPYLARVEIPMWVARNPALVDNVHALVVSQCDITGNYPYILTRADELAVVRSPEKQALEELIYTEMLRNQQTISESSKLIGKHHTRADRRRYGDHF